MAGVQHVLTDAKVQLSTSDTHVINEKTTDTNARSTLVDTKTVLESADGRVIKPE